MHDSSLPAPSNRRFLRKDTVVLSAFVVAVSAVLIFLAVDYERKRPVRSAVQEITMPDGTVLVLKKVTFGRQHQFEPEVTGGGGFSLFSRPGRRVLNQTTVDDQYMFWFTRRDAVTGRALDFDWWSHCAAVDDHGCEMEDRYPSRDAFSATSSTSGGGRPFQPLNDNQRAAYDQIIVRTALQPFRHSGATFKLRVYDMEGTMVAEFDVPDPSPLRGQYPVWEAEALPVTKSDGDLTVTLKALAGAKAERYVDSGSRADTIRLTPNLEINQNGQPTAEWSRQNIKVLDTVGNTGGSWDCHLCPLESAWKVQVRLFRGENAQFDPTEQWSVPGVAVPATGISQPLNQSHTVQEITIELLAFGGSGGVVHYGLAPDYSGSWGYSGGFNIGTKNYECRIDTESRSGAGSTTTVKCELPHIVARVSGLDEDHYTPDVRITDDQGRAVKTYGPMSHASSTQLWFMELAPDAAALDFTFIGQKGRMVEFVVKPPQLEPLKGVRLDLTSPEGIARRTARMRRQMEQHRSALETDPDNASVCNELAWLYATAPAELRNARKAVELAEKAMSLEPNDATYRYTQVLAYTRADEHEKAVGVALPDDAAEVDWRRAMAEYARAMSFSRLDETAPATESFTQALRLHKQLEPKLSPWDAHDLKSLRTEAIPLFLGGQPAEVFARGDQLARAESWDKAAAEFARGLAVYPDEHWNWYRSGPLWLQLGDLEAYRRHCRSVLDLFGSTTNGYVAERTAKLCLIVPDVLPDDPRPAALADIAVSNGPDFCWFLLVKALAEYRAGDFQDALTAFERAKQAQSNNAYSLAIINLFLAMSHHRLDQADAARDRLAEGVQIIEQQLPKPGSGDVGEGWHDWLMCQLVRREAEMLVRVDGRR